MRRTSLARPFTVAVPTVALTLALAGCGADLADDGDPTPAASDEGDADAETADDASDGTDVTDDVPEDGLLVVSTVAPVADIVAQVLGDRGEVESLIPAGMDSHTYEPRPADVVPLTDADVFIGNGLHLNDAAVDLAAANLPDDAPLVLLGEEALSEEDLAYEADWDGGHGHTHADGDGPGHTHDDDPSHTHDDGDDPGHTHDDDGHTHGRDGVNPHVWTSVPNAIVYVDAAAAALAEVDPQGADHYEQRAADYRAELELLDDAIRTAVGTLPEEDRKLVVYHDAWLYFGRTYDVEVIAAVQPSDFSEPSAADVRAIIDQIRDEDVPAVFGAEEFPTGVIETIAAETGATYVGELADDTLPGEPGDPAHGYLGMMATNTAVIVESLGGDALALHDLGVTAS
jgi:ABC-type Zn uptake system ZnuABC Zn-binding protein ZnuA